MSSSDNDHPSGIDIAIVGMSGRFPGARTIEEFWQNLRDGVESVRVLADDELLAAGVSPHTLADPDYVRSAAVLDDVEYWDAGFWGFTPKDAAIMDPQHRLFLECAWEALESSGHAPGEFDGPIGVFAGCGMQAYMAYNLVTNRELMESVGLFLVRHTGNDKDFLSTRVSYQLNLTGPSINVQTACSTSLVAVHLATQSLLNGEVDMALAGGVTIEIPHRVGYTYKDGEILSPDGHCRAFDAESQGTIFGSGAGVVVLRRLADAIEDGDEIHAVIRGSAVNNDGSTKVGYLAPSVDGQAASIVEALGISGVNAESVTYIEAHGTGTPIGDPIEVAALTRAFRMQTDRKQFCGIGSLKSNIGHLDTAAGVASLIKTVLALRNRQIPPTLNFSAPNPMIDFASSPFFVNSELRNWESGGGPRRAGVSSLGVGGTNAHVVLEEAPARPESGASREWKLISLSARTPSALDVMTTNLADHLYAHPEIALADAAYTLHVGRQPLRERRITVVRDTEEAAATFEALDAKAVFSDTTRDGTRSLAFMFAGGGAQYASMGAELYRTERVFRDAMDDCLSELKTIVDFDLAALLYPDESMDKIHRANDELERPSRALPALFATQYACAMLWNSWGVNADAMIGHSMGEYTAAHLAGVFSLRDALSLVALRGRLFEKVAGGGMLSVSLPANHLRPLLGAQLSVAAENAPALSVASGPVSALDALEQRLAAIGADYRRVPINVAAHSSMLEPVLDEFAEFLRTISMSPPRLPFLSNLTGTWIKPEEATDPDYWVRHLRNTVRFADGVGELLKNPDRLLLEVGPGRVLASLARQHPTRADTQPVIYSMRHPDEQASDVAFMLTALGRVWAAGGEIDWSGFYANERRLRVSLPTYPFERQRHWIDAVPTSDEPKAAVAGRRQDLADWFSHPSWKRTLAPSDAPQGDGGQVLMFVDETGLGEQVADGMRKCGQTVTEVRAAHGFGRSEDGGYTVSPGNAGDYKALLSSLRGEQRLPEHIVHLWNVTHTGEPAKVGSVSELSFFSLLFLAQAIGREDITTPIRLDVIANDMMGVAGETSLSPQKALVLGPCRVIPSEFPNITVRAIDIALPPGGSSHEKRLVELVTSELRTKSADTIVAYREGARWVETVQPARLEAANALSTRVREGGVYLITGGFGGLGFTVAEHLARTARARLVLVGRSAKQRPNQVAGLTKLGAEVMTASADVTSRSEMETVIRDARARFGRIDGVIHAAGVLNDELILTKTRESAEAVLAPKVAGTIALDEALGDLPLDFFILFSSVSSIAGITGQVDYAAANAFIDAFACERTRRDGTFTVSINWSSWRDVGMVARLANGPGEPEASTSSHPLLDRLVSSSPDGTLYSTHLGVGSHWLMKEHRLRGGRSLIPGTGYIEIARAAFAHASDSETAENAVVEINDVAFMSPFVVDDDESREMRVHVDRRSGAFVIAGRDDNAEGGIWEEHVTGSVRQSEAQPGELDIDAIRQRCRLSSETFDGTEENVHLEFGRRWGNLKRIDYGEGEALIELELPEEFAPDVSEYALHPALMDMATASAQSLILGFSRDDFFVPLSYTNIVAYAPLPRCIYSHIRLQEGGFDPREMAVFDVTVTDRAGRELVSISEFMMTRITDKARLSGISSRQAPGVRRTIAWLDDPRPAASGGAAADGLEDAIRPEEGLAALDRILASRGASQFFVSPWNLHSLVEKLRAPAGTTDPKHVERPPPAAVSEIEAVVALHPAVRSCVVLQRRDRPGNTRLVAYVAQHPNENVTVSDLRRFVRSKLPQHMVPSNYVTLDSIPANADGSVDRGALPDPFGAEDDFVAPRNETETLIADIWREVLGVERVSVYDNFFDIGGHSLLAVRVVTKLDKKIGVRLNQAIMVLQTLEQISAECDKRLADVGPTGGEAAAGTDGPGIGRKLLNALKQKVTT